MATRTEWKVCCDKKTLNQIQTVGCETFDPKLTKAFSPSAILVCITYHLQQLSEIMNCGLQGHGFIHSAHDFRAVIV